MLTLEGYTLDGFKLTLSLPCDTVEQALRHLRTVVESGITPLPQDLDAQETKTITSVVRRVHTNKKTGKKTPVVDLYSSWQGDYGQFRFCGVYLNSPEDIAQFEAQSGLNLLNMPLYKSQGPLQRIQISRDDVEIACKPFTAHKVMGKEKDIDGSGKMQHTWDFAGYGASIQTAFQDTPAKPAPQKSVQADNPAPTPPATVQVEQHWSSDSKLVNASFKWALDTFDIKQSDVTEYMRKIGVSFADLSRDEFKARMLAYNADHDAEKISKIGEGKSLSHEVIVTATSFVSSSDLPQ